MEQSAGPKIKRSELVELFIPASSVGKVNFQTIATLRNQENQVIFIRDIEVFTENTYQASQKTNTILGMPVADISKAVLVLYVNGEESIHYIPLAKLIHTEPTSSVNATNWAGFDDLSNVDFDQSYVQFSVASDAAPYIIPFMINYLRYMKDPNAPDKYVER